MVISQTPRPGSSSGAAARCGSSCPRVRSRCAARASWASRRRSAKAALEQAQFVVVIERQFNETVPKDAVIATGPRRQGAARLHGQARSSRTAPRRSPSRTSARKSYDAAAAAITGRDGSSPQRADAFSDTVPAGQVIRTEPAGGARRPAGLRGHGRREQGPRHRPRARPHRQDDRRGDRRRRRRRAARSWSQGAYSPGKKVRAQSPAEGHADAARPARHPRSSEPAARRRRGPADRPA